MGKPVIGITTGVTGPEWEEYGRSWLAYSSAVEEAGATAVRINRSVLGRERAVLESLQGILFSGGDDIDLRRYPNPPKFPGRDLVEVMAAFRMTPEPDRDEFEIPLLQAALDRDLPILGICRGCQVLNVALGGRLLLDIPQEVPSALLHRSDPETGESSRHALRILPGTRLAEALPPELPESQWCNSRHHQGVLPDHTLHAQVVAVSPEDNLVEAIEVPERRWAVGVQWHPELLRDPDIRAAHRGLFRAFVAAAS